MIGGLIVGLFGIFSIAYLTWMLIKTHRSQTLNEGSRIVRTMIIGFSYTLQLGIMAFLSTGGKAYQWFRETPLPARADTPFVVGIAVGIFLGAGLLQLIKNGSSRRN